MSSELTAATAIVRDGISNGNTDEQIARRVLDTARAGEGLREAIAALKPASNLQGSPVNAYCMARDAALALIDAARAGEPDWETLYVEESERYVRLSNEVAARAGEGLDETLLRKMVERPLTSAYFEDYDAGRLDSEQVARALAGDYATLLRAALHPDTAAEPGEDLNHLNATTFPDTVPGTCYVHKTYDCPMCHPRTLAATERTDEPGGEP